MPDHSPGRSTTAIVQVAEQRRRLWAADFRPVALYSADVTHTDGGDPIPPQSRGKRPWGDRWQERARSNPPEAAAERPRGNVLNTGFLCDGLRILDFDIEDAAIVAQLSKLAVAMLGDTIVRTRSNSPRCAMVYQAAEGEPKKLVIIGAAGKIEVLGHGQQLHAFGPHASGVDLEWHPEPPGVQARDAIPAITEEQVTAYLSAAAKLIGASAQASHAISTTVAKPSPGLGPRPQHIADAECLHLNAAACRSLYSLAEVTAAVESIPDGYRGHPLMSGDVWRKEFLFPLADYAAHQPEHRASVRALFCQHTRRIADPAEVSAYPDGADAYFDTAEKRFDAEVRDRSIPGRLRPDIVGIGRLIHSTLGNRPEAVAAGWGGRWDGCTALHRPGLNCNAPAGGQTSSGNTGAGANTGAAADASSFFAPVPFDAPDLYPVPWLVLGLLIRGDITILAGQGGGAKTALMIAIAVTMACGRSTIGPFMVRTREGGLRVALISAEEDPNRIGLLVAAACATMALSTTERALVRANLRVHDAGQSGWRLGEARLREREEIAPEQSDAALAMLNAALAQHQPDVLMMDTFATLLALPSEIENSLVTRLMNRLARAAREAGCAVLLLHHTPKLTRAAAAEQRGEATLVRGGSAITNTARVVYTITSLPDTESGLIALSGVQPDTIRRLEPVKINDAALLPPAHIQLVSAKVTVQDGTDHAVRAVQFIVLPQAASDGISDAHRNLAMKAIDAGAVDQYGARVPLSPSTGGKSNRRDPIQHIAGALQTFHSGLSDVQVRAAAKELLKELRRIGCVVDGDAVMREDGSFQFSTPAEAADAALQLAVREAT